MRTKIAMAAALLAVAGLSASAALAGGTPLSTTLTGLEEKPGPGDPDGSGFISLTLNQGQGQICFDLTVSNLDTVIAGHIHKAPAGHPGPVFVGLFSGAAPASACVSATKDQVKAIRQNPEQYYVNVHTNTFQAGAVRGQLGD